MYLQKKCSTHRKTASNNPQLIESIKPQSTRASKQLCSDPNSDFIKKLTSLQLLKKPHPLPPKSKCFHQRANTRIKTEGNEQQSFHNSPSQRPARNDITQIKELLKSSRNGVGATKKREQRNQSADFQYLFQPTTP